MATADALDIQCPDCHAPKGKPAVGIVIARHHTHHDGGEDK